MRKGINISHVNTKNMGGRDQSQIKVKFRKFKKVKSVPKTYQKVIMMTLGDSHIGFRTHGKCYEAEISIIFGIVSMIHDVGA